jgi:arylmalonate decarboxylase
MAGVTLGLTSPVQAFDRSMAEDAVRVMGSELELLQEPVGVKRLSVEGYSAVIDGVGEAAKRLVVRGASAVMIGGTSLTFFRGHEFHNALLRGVEEATGVPVSSTSKALLEALAAVAARRLAVATAYTEPVSELLRTFLAQAGFETLSLRYMGFEQAGLAPSVPPQEIIDFAKRAFEDAPQADCLLISCAGLKTLDVSVPLEETCGVPVVSSYQSTIWGLARLAGIQPKPGFGRLMDGRSTPAPA